METPENQEPFSVTALSSFREQIKSLQASAVHIYAYAETQINLRNISHGIADAVSKEHLKLSKESIDEFVWHINRAIDPIETELTEPAESAQ